MNSTSNYSATLTRYSKPVHNFYHNIGISDMDNDIESSENIYTINIEFKPHALMLLLIVLLLIGFISLYVCFFKWVSKGHIDLPRFGSESSQIINESLENTASASQESSDNAGQEYKRYAEIMEFD